MATIYAVAGGKGGTGKSVFSILLSRAISLSNKQAILIDGDFGGSNLHTLLGIEFPRRNLADFIMKRSDSLKSTLLPTEDKNIQLISGAGDLLGMANLKAAVKTKLISHIKNLEADSVILDLGAGSSFNVLDLFIAANHHVLIISPEPTSLQNVYEFLKFSLNRILRVKFSKNEWLQSYLNKFIFPNENNSIATITELLNIVGAKNKEWASEIEQTIRNFKPYIIINMAEEQAEAEKYFQTIKKSARHFLSIDLMHMGTVFKGQEIQNAIKRGESLLSVKLGINSNPLIKIKSVINNEASKVAVNINNKKPNARLIARLPFKKDCSLSNDGFGIINCRAFDISKRGLGVLFDNKLPFKNCFGALPYENMPFKVGDELFAHSNSMKWIVRAKVRWIKKDVERNATRVGLKFSPTLPY
jgi:flagellar biosynthesis protein FlhG